MESRGGGDNDDDGGSEVLSLHQIRTVHGCNDYEENPAPGHAPNVGEGSPPAPWGQRPGTEGCPSDEAVQEQPRSSPSRSGGPPEQRTLGNVVNVEESIREQPQVATKLLVRDGKPAKRREQHLCERCGRKGSAGAKPRPLPSCWLCGGRCLCSPEAAAEYLTCVCCLKALLYHCSSDDEDSSADAPFSCRASRRWTRWGTAAALALVLPCLLCYAPAKGCLVLCQLCHDRARSDGCRCKRVEP